jgi:hypothetical protein
MAHEEDTPYMETWEAHQLDGPSYEAWRVEHKAQKHSLAQSIRSKTESLTDSAEILVNPSLATAI